MQRRNLFGIGLPSASVVSLILGPWLMTPNQKGLGRSLLSLLGVPTAVWKLNAGGVGSQGSSTERLFPMILLQAPNYVFSFVVQLPGRGRKSSTCNAGWRSSGKQCLTEPRAGLSPLGPFLPHPLSDPKTPGVVLRVRSELRPPFIAKDLFSQGGIFQSWRLDI